MGSAPSPVRTTDRPILFTDREAPLVRAFIREAREPGTGKTQHRVALKPQPAAGQTVTPFRTARCGFQIEDGAGLPVSSHALPYAVGDRLWVRETWKPHSIYAHLKSREVPPSKVFYRADDGYAPSNTPWRPSIFMPRWASRLTLIVSEVRVERLASITDQDAIEEGALSVELPTHGPKEVTGRPPLGQSPRSRFRHLWGTLHGPDAWDDNPWIAALTVRPILANIDALPEAYDALR